ncbi:MAG: hypothetical protein QOH06_842 [Acidobacteriota bacterium]|jgi:hypothetical protein|nr:hypothetical protein [Acidobacteriota bacterium]
MNCHRLLVHARVPLAALLLAALSAVTAIGCAGRHKPETAPEAPPPASAVEPSLRDLCREGEPVEENLLDNSRRRIEETFCGATLWFDGLFGRPDVENARAVSGRVELSTIYTEADGAQPRARLRLKYDLPNLDRRVNLFLGRDDRDDFVQGRQEGFAIRSSVFGIETEDRWLAGLGYSPPGRWKERLDFRVGARLSTAPEVFVQSRLRRNVFLGERSVWRLRETVFYENRDGFGSTSSADFDYVLKRRALLFHWGTVGTVSEATDGLDWRSATVLYQNLGSRSALAYELFLRGSTGDEVDLREYGARTVYRRPLNREWLFGELIGGYTWPRESLAEQREGSVLIGFGLELLFGRDPY